MNETFNLDETSKVFIYGCGTVGKEAADKLPACIPNIKGYIDRNAKNIKIFESAFFILLSRTDGPPDGAFCLPGLLPPRAVS